MAQIANVGRQKNPSVRGHCRNVFQIRTGCPHPLWQGLLGVKSAVEKAMAANGGKKPNAEEMAAAMKGLEWEAPSGLIQMKLGNGHQAIQPNAIGTTKWDEATGTMTLVDVEYYSATCVNPPEGVKAVEWLKAGFKSANCD